MAPQVCGRNCTWHIKDFYEFRFDGWCSHSHIFIFPHPFQNKFFELNFYKEIFQKENDFTCFCFWFNLTPFICWITSNVVVRHIFLSCVKHLPNRLWQHSCPIFTRGNSRSHITLHLGLKQKIESLKILSVHLELHIYFWNFKLLNPGTGLWKKSATPNRGICKMESAGGEAMSAPR